MLFLVVSFWLGFFALLVYVIGVVGQVYDDAPKWKKKHSRDQKVVFVIAHPDDESMFFAPTLSTLRDRLQQECFILCLSTGNYDGLGETRETELLAAGALCGIPADRIRLLDHPLLQDGPDQRWPADLIAEETVRFCSRHDIQTIITFDAHGVSGHINHIDTFRGVRQLLRRQHRQEAGGQESATQLRALAEAPAKATTSALLTSASHLEAYTLASVGLHRKYIGPFDIIVHYAYSLLTQPCSALKPSALSSSSSSTLDSLVSDSFCFVNVSHSFVCRLMQAHRSQFVWFRWLFVLFSRYVVFNELTPMQVIEEKEEK